jgi:hypothetical protein
LLSCSDGRRNPRKPPELADRAVRCRQACYRPSTKENASMVVSGNKPLLDSVHVDAA